MKLLIKITIYIFGKLGYTVTIYKKTNYTNDPNEILHIYTNGHVGIGT